MQRSLGGVLVVALGWSDVKWIWHMEWTSFMHHLYSCILSSPLVGTYQCSIRQEGDMLLNATGPCEVGDEHGEECRSVDNDRFTAMLQGRPVDDDT